MKTFKLIALKLENFKGIRSFELAHGGDAISVIGDNATGKTTLYDAFLWLLFDKDSRGSKDFEIKTMVDGQPIPMLDHAVTGVFELAGKQITLKKVYAEKYTKKRGRVEQEFTGHTTDYYVDDVPVKQKEFKDKVAEIADEDLFRLLTNPLYFNEGLSWGDRRKVLLEICGDITDEEVIASDLDFANLKGILNGHTLDDHKKIVVSRRQAINKRLDEIPVRIDQINADMPEGPKSDPLAAIKKIYDLQDKVSGKRLEISRIENGGQIAEQKKQLAELEAAQIKFRNEYQKGIDTLVSGKRKELAELNNTVGNLESSTENHKRQAEGLEQRIKELTDQKAKLLEQWKQVNAEQFEYAQGDACPTCGQPLPEKQVEAARNKARARFDEDKQRRLDEIGTKGQTVKLKIDDLNKSAVELQAIQKKTANDLAAAKEAAGAMQQNIDRLTSEIPDLTELEEWKDMRGQIMAIEAEIEGLQEGNAESLKAINAEIADIDSQIREQQRTVSNIEHRQRLEDQAAELKAEEKKLAAEFETLEGQLYLCEQFTRAKVAMLDEKINQHFSLCSFRLFKEQINGGLQEVCECTVNGVPYGSINNAARTQAGLDIINTLSRHHGFAPCVWIDNRESIVNLPEMDQQIISLYVDAGAKELSIA